MDFYNVIEKRRSVRAYKPEPVDPEALKRIGEAVRLAPSACNIQPWTFRVILDERKRRKICEVYTREWLAQAPAIVLAIGNTEKAWKRPDGNNIVDIDIGIAMEHFVLAATAEGIGTCWICAYEIGKMNKAAGILPPWSVLAISPLGYPADAKAPPEKKKMDELFRVC
jgi:nitroreductase